MRTEYASTGQRGLGAYEALAQRSGKPLAHIVELAAENRLGDLFDERGFVGRPQTPTEALRRLEKMRHAPGEKPRSPHAALGELRGWTAIWRAESDEEEYQRRRRDPLRRLSELYAKRTRWAV